MHGHAAQLFRDIYFQKYKRKENGKCDIGSIYNDPTQKKSQLNRNSFYQHIDKINKHIKSYCSTVTWLGSSKFHPEDRGAEEEDNNNSSGKKTLSSDSKDLFHSVKKEWGKNLEINNDNNIEEHEAAQRQSKTLNNKESNKSLPGNQDGDQSWEWSHQVHAYRQPSLLCLSSPVKFWKQCSV